MLTFGNGCSNLIWLAFLKVVLSKEVNLTLLPTFKEELNHGNFQIVWKKVSYDNIKSHIKVVICHLSRKACFEKTRGRIYSPPFPFPNFLGISCW